MSRSFVPAAPEQVRDREAAESKRLVSYARTHSVGDYVIYGPELSYFTRKLHAAVHWSHLPYRWLPKHAQIQAELEARASTHQIPVLVTPENWAIADTTPLLHLLDGRLPHAIFFPTYNVSQRKSTAITGALVHIVEEYLDEWLPRAAVVYRWTYEASASYAAPLIGRDSTSGMGPEAQKMAAGVVQAWGTKALRALGVAEKEEQRKVEAEFLQLFSALERHLSAQRARFGRRSIFVLGCTPCAVDAVLIGSLWAHFASDPAAVDALQACPGVLAWADDLTRKLPSGVWSWTEHEPLDLATLESSFFGAALHLMAGPYMRFLRANAVALQEKKKTVAVDVYSDGRMVSLLARPYPELSRRNTSRWISTHLSPGEKKELELVLTRFGMADFLSDDGLGPFASKL